MLEISAELLKEYAEHKDIEYTASVVLSSGDTITLTEDDFVLGGCNILRDNGADVLPLGYVYCTQLTLSLYDKSIFQKIDFFNAQITVNGSYTYSSGTFLFRLGTYTITEPMLRGATIELVGYDDVYKADKPCSITGSMRVTALFERCCYDCGINIDKNRVTAGIRAFPSNWDSVTTEATVPDGLSYRQVMGMCAMIFGANVYISPFDNYVYVLPLRASSAATIISYWGGVFDAATPYETGDVVNGGSFNPWNSGDSADSGSIDTTDIIMFSDPLNPPTLGTSEIIIGGVRMGNDEKEYKYGSGYLLTVENRLFEGNEQSAIDIIGTAVEGVAFRTFELEYTSYPFADLMQRIVFVDRQGRGNPSLITHMDIQLRGVSRFKCTGDSPDRAYSKDSYRSAVKIASNAMKAANNALVQARADLTAYDEEVQRLAKLIANAFGAFETEEVLQDGSKIYYMHDKPSLAASTTIWKRSIEGFVVSTDGGQTWNAGMDASGRAVVNILSAVGIYADWIKTGTISSVGGSSYWNLNTGEFNTVSAERSVRISNGYYMAYDSDGRLVGRIGASKIRYGDGIVIDKPITGIYGYKSLTLGLIGEGGGVTYYICINDDITGETSPYGYTEHLLFFGNARFIQKVIAAVGIDTTKLNASTSIETPKLTASTRVYTPVLSVLGTDGVEQVRIQRQSESLPIITGMSSVKRLRFGLTHINDSTDFLDAFYIGRKLYDVTVEFVCDVYTNKTLYYMYLVQNSDERKKNIVEWDDRYNDIIDDIKLIEFSWKNGDDKLHVGMSAQQIQSLLDYRGINNSGLVTGGENLAIEYNGIVALLVKRVQEQTKKIMEQEEKIMQLEKRLETLERLVKT